MPHKTLSKPLQEGDPAPDFSLMDDSGKTVKLSDLRGKTVVLYFYPKDDTSGCTREACSFRDHSGQLKIKGVVVLGVSADSAQSHAAFKSKYRLSFPLLVDCDRKVMTAYGAYGRKVMYGKETVGVIRSTFVIDPQGKLRKIFRNVRVDGHTEQVLAVL